MDGKEKLIFGDDYVNIDGDTKNVIMHNGEKTLMLKLAELATKNGGDILEIGFGLHLSADGVQSNPNVTSHTIIEIHPDIYQIALGWAKNKPNTTIILGDWIDILPNLNVKFDGILHDTHLDPNIPKFLDYVLPNCKNGAIVAFFAYNIIDSRLNAVRVKLSKSEHESLPYNKNCYFNNGDYELKYTTFNGNTFYSESYQKNRLI